MKPAPSPWDLHTQAARNHEEVAQFHRNAAVCHAQHQDAAAQISAHSAMECCTRAQSHSEAACRSTVQATAQAAAHPPAQASAWQEQAGMGGSEATRQSTRVGTLHLKPR